MIPSGSTLRDRCVVVDAHAGIPDVSWLAVTDHHDKIVATHVAATPGRLARRVMVREATALEPVVTRPIHLAQRAFARFGWPDLSTRSSSCYAVVTGPALLTPLGVYELEGGRQLGITAWLPVHAAADQASALIAAVASLNERFTWCWVHYEPNAREVRVQRAFDATVENTTVDVVANLLDLVLHFANTVGVALARVALGHATMCEVEASVEALLNPTS